MKYEVRKSEYYSKVYPGETKYVLVSEGCFFGGYDFMGSVDWVEQEVEAYFMDIEEAEQIKADLESGDM